jgi:serine/threonine-protein kinase
MRKVALTGGAPVTIAKAVNNRGATWTVDDTIIFAPDTPGGLARVAAAGGVPHMLTQPDYAAGEKTHRFPHSVPGRKFVIFTTGMADREYDDARVEILNLETGERRVLFEGGTDARYVPTGHIVFARLGSLYAVRFDLDGLRVMGSPYAVLDNISGNMAIGRAYYAISDTGTLAYARGGAWTRSSRLVLADRSGRVVRTVVDHPTLLLGPKLSPEGKHILATAFGANYQLWVFDLIRGSSTRITTAWDNEWPVWSHHGTRVMFSSTRGGVPHLHAQNADGAHTSGRLSANPGSEFAASPDGEALASVVSAGQNNSDIALLRPTKDWMPEPLIQEPGNQRYPRFSPDGRWLAYMSDETGRFEVYVRPYPSLDRKWSVSTTGGRVPVWSRDGREVLFRDVSRFYSVSIQTNPLRIRKPTLLFEDASYEPGVFDVTPEGYLLLTRSDENEPREIAVVVNWFAELANDAKPPRM